MFNEWYLARDWGSVFPNGWIKCWPTQLTGVKKTNSCVDYRPTDADFTAGDDEEYSAGMALTVKVCKKIFGHCPEKGELLCVTKTRGAWKSEEIELEFS